MNEFHQEAEYQRKNDSKNAADAGQRHGFSNELEADVAPARANGLAHPDFPCPLRD